MEFNDVFVMHHRISWDTNITQDPNVDRSCYRNALEPHKFGPMLSIIVHILYCDFLFTFQLNSCPLLLPCDSHKWSFKIYCIEFQ